MTKMLPKPPPKFDLSKLELMVEPFNVRVERQRGNMRHEIPLPQDPDGGAPGTNWSKDSVRGIGEWLVNQWSGGGHYHIAVVDSSTPPIMMEWPLFYPPQDYPERVPPPLQGSATAPTPTNYPQPQQPQQQRPMFNGGALPTGYPQQAQQQPQQAGYFPPTPSQQQGGYPVGYVAPNTFDADRRRLEDALAQAQTQLAQAREQAAQQAFERKATEMKAEADRRFNELQQLIVAQRQAPTHSPEIEALKEQNRIMAEQIRATTEAADRARREQELRDLIRSSQEATQRQIAEANARYEAIVRESAKAGPDPMILMFQEQMRMQVEAMKEMARGNQAQLDRVQQQIMRPQDLLQIVKDSSNGADQVQMQLNRTWQDMLQTQRQMFEHAAQLNPSGGSEGVALARDVIGGLQGMVEKYTGGKSREAVAAIQSQAQVAQAQAAVIASQNTRLADQARVEANIRQQQGNGHAVNGNGLNGHAMPQVAGPNGDTRVEQTSSATPSTAAAAPPTQVWPKPAPTGTVEAGAHVAQAPQAATPIAEYTPTGPVDAAGLPVTFNPNRKIKGRTDAEWFGVLLPKIVELRLGVDRLVESLSMVPVRMDPKDASMPDGVVPEQTADALYKAGMHVMQNQIPIPAMIDLLMQGMFADFMDVLLPDAPQAYRDDVVKILIQMTGGLGEDPDEDDEEDPEEQPQPAAS